jgi:hypothetical protein
MVTKRFFIGFALSLLTSGLLASTQVNAADTESVTLFDNLAPEDINLTMECGYNPCTYDADLYNGYGGSSDGGNWGVGSFTMLLPPAFDAQAKPWMRMVSYQPNGGSTVTNTNLEYEFLPPAALISAGQTNPYNFAWIESTAISGMDYVDPAQCIQGLCAYTIDNVVLEFISNNISVDFDPWSADNEIRPKNNYFITIQVSTTSIADGDAYDFNAADVDPATLRVGTQMAEIATAALTLDLDNDGDMDKVFGFRMEDTGLTCIDTSIMIAGRTFSGDPIVGHDTIVPVDCEDIVDIDVDPFNASNIVRPNDDYQLTVGILGMNTADGDAIDLDATQVDVDSLRFGPAAAPNTSSPITGLLDGDSNTDLLLGFSMLDSGIACGDTELEMTGSLYSGQPIEGVDTIATTDCETTGCHP